MDAPQARRKKRSRRKVCGEENGAQRAKERVKNISAEGRESLKAAALLIGRAISPFTVSPPDDRKEKEEREMKIRVTGIESECQAAREYYRELEKESNVKSVSISKNYPNRGSNTIFRVYVEVEYYDAANPSRALIQKRRDK